MLTPEQQNRVELLRKKRSLNCGGPCGHTQDQHDAFDLGIADGESRQHQNPFDDHALSHAWSSTTQPAQFVWHHTSMNQGVTHARSVELVMVRRSGTKRAQRFVRPLTSRAKKSIRLLRMKEATLAVSLET